MAFYLGARKWTGVNWAKVWQLKNEEIYSYTGVNGPGEFISKAGKIDVLQYMLSFDYIHAYFLHCN